ncbi:MAG: tRNA(Ile)(2)-agmatinylcytidine synthase [Thermoproteota archaeon]|nr:tRNA(Ile)(2)-agmatinylcytidine synthase [Thermoproteota archaeon]
MVKSSKMQTLHIGFDDTDSRKGMCTTYLAYKIVNDLKKSDVEFLDYPKLIRFNPNIPWKTRGNGAVGISIRVKDPERIKKLVKNSVTKYSDIKNGANPGLVFLQDDKIPKFLFDLSETALYKLIHRNSVKKFSRKNRLEMFNLGNGQGLVGALGAIGYRFSDHTFELLSYRNKQKFGSKRILEKDLVKKMQEKTIKNTFNSYDLENDSVLITPNGPDPVFYGIRGEDPKSVISASKMLDHDEKLDGYMIFKTNQGTGDHLKNEIDIEKFQPYTSGTVNGIVSSIPIIEKGGHVFFMLKTKSKKIRCGVYKPTKITHIARNLTIGDTVYLGGGVRKASRKYSRVFNIEFLHIKKLVNVKKLENPFCKKCKKHMKSEGTYQGFKCIRCGKTSDEKNIKIIPRQIKVGLYIPTTSAHRHLTRPKERLFKRNLTKKLSKNIQWINTF